MPPAEVLYAENLKLKEALSAKEMDLSTKEKDLLAKDAQRRKDLERIAELEAQIAWLRRQVFATGKSEKVDPAQMQFDFEQFEQTLKQESQKLRQITYERKEPAPRRSKEELYGHLPVLEEVVVEPNEVQADPAAYERIGEEETFEIKIDPPRFYRRRIVRPKYRRKQDREQAPVVAPAPVRVVEGLASRSLLIYIVLAKFLDHMPLYRQSAQFKRYQVSLPRQNMVRWVEKVAEWLKPVYHYMAQELRQGDYIQADETPIRYCDPDYGEKKSRQGFLCGYSRPGGNVCYAWTQSRSSEAITAFLEGFQGILQCDAYRGYESFARPRPHIVLAGCMAHARRKFHEALDAHPREAALVLRLMAKLYRVEARIREGGLDAQAARNLRQSHSLNTHRRLHRVLLILQQRSLPKDLLGKACAYALGQWKPLSQYLEHGHIQIDNNLMENAIRPTAVGKKNWLFVGHPEAGDRPAVLYSILISCQRLGVDPAQYLDHVLSVDTRILPKDQLAALTPANWKKAQSS